MQTCEGACNCVGAQAGTNAELEELEAQLPVSDILLFRLLAERSTQHPAELQPAADPETGQPASDTTRCLLVTHLAVHVQAAQLCMLCLQQAAVNRSLLLFHEA